jgi:Icc-related predicted phosphoesterase
MILKRKSVKEAIKVVDMTCPDALVTVGDVEAKGGYILDFKSRILPLGGRFSPKE